MDKSYPAKCFCGKTMLNSYDNFYCGDKCLIITKSACLRHRAFHILISGIRIVAYPFPEEEQFSLINGNKIDFADWNIDNKEELFKQIRMVTTFI